MRILLFIILVFMPALTAASQIVVPVTFKYQGRSVTASMAVDTGATMTTIGTNLADRLGVPADTGRGGMAEVADGRAVRFRTALMNVVAGDMSHSIDVNVMEYTGDRDVEGWLGMNFLDQMTMTIDWKHKRIYWSE